MPCKVMIKNLQNKNKQLNAIITLKEKINSLESKSNSIEQYGRWNNNEITGIPNSISDENLESTVINVPSKGTSVYVMADDMADVMADDQDFKQGMLVGETFSEILVEGQKSGDSMFCGSSLEKLAKAGQFFLNELQKQPFYSYLGSCEEHKFSYSCYVMIDHHVIHIFYIFLLPLISIAYSDSIYDWRCLFVYLKCKFASTILFLFWVL